MKGACICYIFTVENGVKYIARVQLNFDISNIKVQTGIQLFALFFFSTPLCKVRYQKIAGFIQRCLFLRHSSAHSGSRSTRSKKIWVFHKLTTAFLYTIRGPPSEI